MKMELKHWAAYLPFNVKCQYEGIVNGRELSKERERFESDNEPYPNWEYYEPIKEIKGIKIAPLNAVRKYKKHFIVNCGVYNNELKNFYNGHGAKLILKTLSQFGEHDIIEDLEKVNKFIGLGKWCEAYDDYFNIWFDDKANVDKLILQAPQEIFNYFLANHYDVFGLIKEGLAISESD